MIYIANGIERTKVITISPFSGNKYIAGEVWPNDIFYKFYSVNTNYIIETLTLHHAGKKCKL